MPSRWTATPIPDATKARMRIKVTPMVTRFLLRGHEESSCSFTPLSASESLSDDDDASLDADSEPLAADVPAFESVLRVLSSLLEVFDRVVLIEVR